MPETAHPINAILVARSDLGVRVRTKRSPDSILEARGALNAAVLEKRIREVVDKAPPFTPAQRARLISLFADDSSDGNGKLAGKLAASALKGGEQQQAFPASFPATADDCESNDSEEPGK